MSIRLTHLAIIPVVLVAAGLALHQAEPEGPASAATAGPGSALASGGETLPSQADLPLPPNHPSIGGAVSPHGAMAPPAEAPAITWKVPSGWQTAPNPNAMRLATYRAPGGVEISVSRAGGATEANLERWKEQFQGAGPGERADRTAHGVHVVTLDLAGTYLGGGMGFGAQAAAHPDWAMAGAIVESRAPSYFFKMIGPAAAVRAARAAFDGLVEGISPT